MGGDTTTTCTLYMHSPAFQQLKALIVECIS